MIIKEYISNNLDRFKHLCKDHKVKYLYAFGSSTNDLFNPQKSDIDLVVEIDDNNPIERGEYLMDLWDKFEDFFQRNVDLLTENSIKNPILKDNIDKTKILIYDGKGQKILV